MIEETIQKVRKIFGDKCHISLSETQLQVGNLQKVSKKELKALKAAIEPVLGEGAVIEFREDDELLTAQ